MLRKQNNDLFKYVAKSLITQERNARIKSNEIRNEIKDHKELMKERRKSFKFIQNK